MVIKNQDSIDILMNIVDSIASNKDYLSTIDGQIGDGDHGINMNKGFQLCAKKIAGRDLSLADGFIILGETLLEEIGGSMGPLYGMFFIALGDAIMDSDFITKESFLNMIKKGANEICNIGNAKEGDKTML
jgi:dihydroxyacetone kinase-like protein